MSVDEVESIYEKVRKLLSFVVLTLFLISTVTPAFAKCWTKCEECTVCDTCYKEICDTCYRKIPYTCKKTECKVFFGRQPKGCTCKYVGQIQGIPSWYCCCEKKDTCYREEPYKCNCHKEPYKCNCRKKDKCNCRRVCDYKPTVKIKSPKNGAVFRTTKPQYVAKIEITAKDDKNLKQLTVTDTVGVNTKILYTANKRDKNVTILISAKLTPGTHTIRATAVDSIGQVSSDEIKITVQRDKPPTIEIVEPQNIVFTKGKVVSVKIKAKVTDDTGVSKVEFYIDGKKILSDSTPPYEARANVLTGRHILKVIAHDKAGQISTASKPLLVAKPSIVDVTIKYPKEVPLFQNEIPILVIMKKPVGNVPVTIELQQGQQSRTLKRDICHDTICNYLLKLPLTNFPNEPKTSKSYRLTVTLGGNVRKDMLISISRDYRFAPIGKEVTLNFTIYKGTSPVKKIYLTLLGNNNSKLVIKPLRYPKELNMDSNVSVEVPFKVKVDQPYQATLTVCNQFGCDARTVQIVTEALKMPKIAPCPPAVYLNVFDTNLNKNVGNGKGYLDVYATADCCNLSKLVIQLDNKNAKTIVFNPPVKEANYNYTINLSKLSGGMHTIKVTAISDTGIKNSTIISFRVQGDEAPRVKITFPPNSAEFPPKTDIPITVIAWDDHNVTKIKISGFIVPSPQSFEKTCLTKGTFAKCNLTLSNARFGKYTVKAIAYDDKNHDNQTSVSFTVYNNIARNPAPPIILPIIPTEGTTYTLGCYKMLPYNFTIFDANSDLEKVKISLDGKDNGFRPYSNYCRLTKKGHYSCTGYLDVKEGKHTFMISAVDAKNLSAEVTINFTVKKVCHAPNVYLVPNDGSFNLKVDDTLKITANAYDTDADLKSVTIKVYQVTPTKGGGYKVIATLCDYTYNTKYADKAYAYCKIRFPREGTYYFLSEGTAKDYKGYVDFESADYKVVVSKEKVSPPPTPTVTTPTPTVTTPTPTITPTPKPTPTPTPTPTPKEPPKTLPVYGRTYIEWKWFIPVEKASYYVLIDGHYYKFLTYEAPIETLTNPVWEKHLVKEDRSDLVEMGYIVIDDKDSDYRALYICTMNCFKLTDVPENLVEEMRDLAGY